MADYASNNAISMYQWWGEDRRFYAAASDLRMMATNFVRRSYLEGLTSLPRFQDIPSTAIIGPSFDHPRIPVFVSHAWLTAHDPDDSVLQRIRTLIPDHADIAVWIDYCCLPQRRRDGTDDRTPMEQQFFRSQLQYIPTIILKSQLVTLWGERHVRRAWCVVELVVADVFKNLIMKQIYHSKDKLDDAIVFATQTYDPPGWNIVGGVAGRPVAKILAPAAAAGVPAECYNFLLHELDLGPTLLTDLLGQVGPAHIDRLFDQFQLSSSEPGDIPVLKRLLLKVFRFAGSYDVSTIKWSGRVPCASVLPYIMSNLADFSAILVQEE